MSAIERLCQDYDAPRAMRCHSNVCAADGSCLHCGAASGQSCIVFTAPFSSEAQPSSPSEASAGNLATDEPDSSPPPPQQEEG